MKARNVIIAAAAALALGGAGLALASSLRADTTLEFRFRDSTSGRWVWDATARLQGREIHAFYQSDAGLLSYRFTRLSPGRADLVLTAPGYREERRELVLKRGANRIAEPIDMTGEEIPGLSRFVFFEKRDEGGDIVAQLRPVDGAGAAILNHPCLPIWVGATAWVQTQAGAPARAPSDAGYARGAKAFSGKLEWSWDPSPESQFRYSARIPQASIAAPNADFLVIDYLVVVPDPRAISRDELEALMARVWALPGQREREAALRAESSRLRFFMDSSRNVEARPR